MDKIHVASKAREKDEVYEFCLSFFPRTVKDLTRSEGTGTENGTECFNSVEAKDWMR